LQRDGRGLYESFVIVKREDAEDLPLAGSCDLCLAGMGCRLRGVVLKLQGLAEQEESRKKDRSEEGKESKAPSGVLLDISGRLWTLVADLQAGTSGSSKPERAAGKLLRAVLGLMDMKDTLCLFKLCRCALALLQVEGAIHGVHSTGVQAAYLNVAKVDFDCTCST